MPARAGSEFFDKELHDQFMKGLNEPDDEMDCWGSS